MPAGLLENDHMVSAGGIAPWHGLGTVLPSESLDAQEALTYAHLDWEVRKFPVYAQTDEVDGYGDPITAVVPLTYATVRMDTTQALGAVGAKYMIVQNSQAFEWMDTLIGDAGGFHYHTAGSLANGRKVWLLAKAPFVIKLPDSPVELYILLSNSHDGSASVTAAATPIRVVCQNTLSAALRGAKALYKIRHTNNAETKLAEAQRVLGLAQGAADLLEKRAIAMLAQKMSEHEFGGFLEKLIPSPNEEDASKRAVTMAETAREAIRSIWTSEPTGVDIRGTAWGAFQAVTYYVDHTQPTHVHDGTAEENRFRRSTGPRNLSHKAMAILEKA